MKGGNSQKPLVRPPVVYGEFTETYHANYHGPIAQWIEAVRETRNHNRNVGRKSPMEQFDAMREQTVAAGYYTTYLLYPNPEFLLKRAIRRILGTNSDKITPTVLLH